MSALPRLSLIIAVFERADVLDKVLTSLAGQSFRDFETIVADDGSGEDVAAVVERHREHLAIRRVWHENRGFRKTVIVNRAVGEARADYLVFIDGDCILHHRFLERHFKRRRRAQVLSGRRVMLDRELTARLTVANVRTRRIERVAFWWRHAGKNDRRNGFYLPFAFAARNLFRRRYALVGCNFSVHRDDFYLVNGYDERIVGRGLEDNNLRARFLNSAIGVRAITHEALQYHCHHQADPIPHPREVVDAFANTRERRTPHGIVKDHGDE
ncbi:MAG: glycosyltransferase [Candidatus Krumholzibacteria bacterium]|nr:glycosyltransferase [Candidatus Krumholzibacteria bacterium]